MQGFPIGDCTLGTDRPVYFVAELSANHHQSLERARSIVRAAEDAGADAVKLQTYTPDSMTLDCDRPEFTIQGGTAWDGQTYYELYEQAYTPREWHPELQELAHDLGLEFFSTAFDPGAVEYLETLGVPVHKTASFELVDLPLIRAAARTGKPLIMSTGLASLAEIEEAVETARGAGVKDLMLLKCTSSYPAPAEEMNLRAIPHLSETFDVPVGLSDHSRGPEVPVAATAMGTVLIEKHFTISREEQGPDSHFSLEPEEFQSMVESVRTTRSAMGTVEYGPSPAQKSNRTFRRSLFVVKDIIQGEPLTEENISSVRPNKGLHPRHYDEVLGWVANQDLERGTPLTWDLICR